MNTRSGSSASGGVSRRTTLKIAAAAAGAAVAPIYWRKASAQSIRLVVRDSGGPFTPAFEHAFYKPFREATGIEVVGVASTHEPTSQIKSMVDTKTYTWNMAEISVAAIEQLLDEGDYLERHELEKDPFVAQIPPEYMSPYGVGCNVYTTVLAYRKDRLKGRAPASWKDLWDVEGVPGRRALRKFPFDTIEQALLADGVPPEKVYPCDFDRAFRSLDRIKPHVAAWWTGGAQATQMLVSGEVDMIPTWVARAHAAIDQGAPVGISWRHNIWGLDSWVILKGTPHLEACRKFIAFCSDPRRQAAWTQFLVNGPTNPEAYKHIDPKRAPSLATYPEHRASAIKIDNRFWAKNKDRALERFNAWILS